MLQRIITASLLIPASIGIMYYANWLGLITLIIVGWLILYEVSSIVQAGRMPLVVTGSLYTSCLLGIAYSSHSAYLCGVGYGLIVLLAVCELMMKRWYTQLILYRLSLMLALMLSSLIAVRLQGFYWLLFGFGVIWSTDSLAMISGKLLGGPKLAPQISPGKTWSGSVTAVVLVGIISGCLSLHPAVPPYSIVIAVSIAIISQVGDLHESLLKRQFNVKDTSALVPGHGGVYDRLDSTLFGMPVLHSLLSLL